MCPHTVDVTISDIRRQLGEYSHWLVGRPLWSQRTRAGCEQAIDCFARAIAETPSGFRAFEG